MEGRDDYRFLKLKDAITCLNQKVNFIGVVLEYGFPKKSKGTDYFCSLKLIDETYPSPGISVNFFTESLEKLPVIASPGDIIQLSHVVMRTHEKEVYALFNKKFSAFALYYGNVGEDIVPYQVSSKFQKRDLDKKFVLHLRKWSLDLRLDRDPNDFQFLKEIKEGQRLNLVCKILHVCEVAKDDWIIFVWDGTDTPACSIQSRLADEMNNPLALQLESEPLPRDVLCTFPCVGSILRVVLDEGNKKVALGSLKVGTWIHFANIVVEIHSGLWRGVLMHFTKFRYVPKEDPVVESCQRSYDERLKMEWGRVPWLSFPSLSRITETDYEDESFVSLMDVLTHHQVTAKFKCVVRVVAAFPWHAQDFLSPKGIYRMRLTLEDPTARLHAYVYAEDGERLFGGFPHHDVLKRKMNKLLGIDEKDNTQGTEYTIRNPPWVVCCVKSYYIHKDDVWGSRHFRIFGTKIVG